MVLSTSKTSTFHNNVIDDVIRKVRCDLVYSGELDESVLSQIQSKWKTKMIQAGVITGTVESSSASMISLTSLQKPEPNLTLNEIDAQILGSKPSMELLMSTKTEPEGYYIPQQDGARDDDIITEPNTYYATNDLDENDELLNEDDDDEEDAIDDDDMNISHLVMCQFDKVKRSKNKWDCKLKSGVMQVNGKNVIFSEATGDFNF